MKGKFFIVLIGIIAFYSCNNENRGKYIKQIDSMSATLDSLKTIAYDTTDQNTQSISQSVHETILKIKQNYKSDTIDLQLAEKIDAYKEIENALSINSGNLAKAKQAIPEVQQKIVDLKHDVENGINDRDKYQEFIDFEKSKIDDIENVLSYYIKTKIEYRERFDSLHPLMKNVLDSYSKDSNE